MREIRVDFAKRRQASVGLLALAVAISGGALAWQMWRFNFLEGQLAGVRTEVAGLNAQLDKAREQRKTTADAQRQAEQIPQARLLAKLKSFPLNDVLTSVESSKTDGVRLTLLEISAENGVVRIECDYDSSESVFRYRDKLNSGATRSWELTSLRSKADASGGGSASIISKW